MSIQNARSNVAGNVPPSSADGQIQINQADDVLFTHKPDGSTRRFLLPKRKPVPDQSVTIATSDTYVGIASLSVSRAIGLPVAGAYPVGHPLTIADENGAVSPTVTLTLTPQGSDKINGASTLALNTPYAAVTLFSDGVSKWTTTSAASGGGAANAVLTVPQNLTGGAQDQARLNVSGPMAGSQSGTNTLVPLDFDRSQFVTGTSTIAMPSTVAPGWCSGVITNSNTIAGLVTLAVPTGHSLDGVSNGNTILYPYQRARLQLVSAGVWMTDWVERSPVVASITFAADSSRDVSIPAGYNRFRVSFSNMQFSVAGAFFCIRFSDTGTPGIKFGSSDYATHTLLGGGTTASSGDSIDNYGYLAQNVNDNAGTSRPIGEYMFAPGATGIDPVMIGSVYIRDNTPQRAVRVNSIEYLGSTSGAIGRVNLVRFLASTGAMNGNVVIRGEP